MRVSNEIETSVSSHDVILRLMTLTDEGSKLGLLDFYINGLIRQSPVMLAEFCSDCDDEIRTLLASDHFDRFWTERFNNIAIPTSAEFRFKDPAPQSKMDFYCGYVLFLEALSAKAQNNTQRFIKYRLKALEFNSFHATNILIDELTEDIANSHPNKIQVLTNFLKQNVSQIKKFKTPGHLLLVAAYCFLAFSDRANANEYVEKCWENLYWSDLLYKKSKKMIYNAYFGANIKLFKDFQVSSMEQLIFMISDIMTNAGIMLNPKIRGSLKDKVTRDFNKMFSIKSVDSNLPGKKSEHTRNKSKSPVQSNPKLIEATQGAIRQVDDTLKEDKGKLSPEPSPNLASESDEIPQNRW